MRRPRRRLEVSTFPFLAVLLCAMGSLILLLLVLDRRAKVAAQARAQEAARTALDEHEAAMRASAEVAAQRAAERAADRERRQRELHDGLVQTQRELAGQLQTVTARQGEATQVARKQREHWRELLEILGSQREELAQAEKEAAVDRTGAAEAEQMSESARKAAMQLSAQLRGLELVLAELKAARKRDAKTYSLMPYHGKRGDARRPLYVECTSVGLVFHPDRKTLTQIATAEEIREEVETRAARQRERVQAQGGQPDKRAYLLMLVRPDGIPAYYGTISALRNRPVDFGYEFIDADWELDFPDDDSAPRSQPWMTAHTIPIAPADPSAPKRHVSGLRAGGMDGDEYTEGDRSAAVRSGSGPGRTHGGSSDLPPLPGAGNATNPVGGGMGPRSGQVAWASSGGSASGGVPGSWGLSGGTGSAGDLPPLPGGSGVGGRGQAGVPSGWGTIGGSEGGPGNAGSGPGSGQPGFGTPGGSMTGNGPGRAAMSGGTGAAGSGPGGTGSGGTGPGGTGPGGTGPGGTGPGGTGPGGTGPGGTGPGGNTGTGGWVRSEGQPSAGSPGTTGQGGGSGGPAGGPGGVAGTGGLPVATGAPSPFGLNLGPQVARSTAGPGGIPDQDGSLRGSAPRPGGSGAAGPPGTQAPGLGQGGGGTGPGGVQSAGQSGGGAGAPGTQPPGPGLGGGGTGPGGAPSVLPPLELGSGGTAHGTGSPGGGVASGDPGEQGPPSAGGAGGQADGPSGGNLGGSQSGAGQPGGGQSGGGLASGGAEGSSSGAGGVSLSVGPRPPAGAQGMTDDAPGAGIRPGIAPTPSGGPVEGPQLDAGLLPSGGKPSRNPAPRRLLPLVGNRDWIIPIECRADGVVLRNAGQKIPLTALAGTTPVDNPLMQSLKQTIARRQASVRPGEPPYRPQARFLIYPDGLRTYYLTFPLLEPLGIPVMRQNVEADAPARATP